jgi:hypothetical protein
LLMFYGCASLTTAPQLPATTLAEWCYTLMFNFCTSLTTPPQLPATTLAGWCYSLMFSHCTSLTTLPALPASTLEANCYSWMFQNSSNIKMSETSWWEYQRAYRIPAVWTWVDASSALDDMFSGTWWTFTGTPNINQTYYTSNQII